MVIDRHGADGMRNIMIDQTQTDAPSPARRSRSFRFRRNRLRAMQRDGGCCRLCGSTDALSMHHVRPRSLGGSDEVKNLATVCLVCHDALHQRAQHLAAWLTWIYGALLLAHARGPPGHPGT